MSMSTYNGSQTNRPNTAQERKQQAYEFLREPEEQLRDKLCQEIINKLSDVRLLVSQVVLEEDDDEVRHSGNE